MPKPKPLELIETRQGCAMCETTPRYNVMHYGRKIGQLWFNMRGYVGTLPTPDGCSLNIGETSIAKWRSAAATLNREWVQHDKEAAIALCLLTRSLVTGADFQRRWRCGGKSREFPSDFFLWTGTGR